jgi:1,4-dihydroxy-2-naphthoyl-CoA synthase
MSSALARNASLLKLKSTEILRLKQQIAAYRTSSKKHHRHIADLEDELETARESVHAVVNPTPFDVIYADLFRNRDVDPSGRRYSMETISWAREISDLSPAAYKVVRAKFLLKKRIPHD